MRGGGFEHPPKNPILAVIQTARANIVFGPLDAMGWIAVDDPEIDSVSQYPADQSERSGRCAGTTAHVRPAAQLVGLDDGPCLAQIGRASCRERVCPYV